MWGKKIVLDANPTTGEVGTQSPLPGCATVTGMEDKDRTVEARLVHEVSCPCGYPSEVYEITSVEDGGYRGTLVVHIHQGAAVYNVTWALVTVGGRHFGGQILGDGKADTYTILGKALSETDGESSVKQLNA